MFEVDERAVYHSLATMQIPSAILGEVVNYFAEDLSKESIVQIWEEDGVYKVVKPTYMEATKARVDYSFSLTTKGKYVMTIHSHNTMAAHFSGVDDADELEIPGLYGVIGRIKQVGDNIFYESAFRYTLGADRLPIKVYETDLFYDNL